ncbi:hypothetical protein RSOL_365430, partial [Rhizoctonia solani AG-3 Rhs1AP]
MTYLVFTSLLKPKVSEPEDELEEDEDEAMEDEMSTTKAGAKSKVALATSSKGKQNASLSGEESEEEQAKKMLKQNKSLSSNPKKPVKEPRGTSEKVVLTARERARQKMRPRPMPNPEAEEDKAETEVETDNKVAVESKRQQKGVVSDAEEEDGEGSEDLPSLSYQPLGDGMRVVKTTKMVVKVPTLGAVATCMRQKTK